MLTELCQEIHNWFDDKKYIGEFTLKDGRIDGDFLQDGQYIRICGSLFNDGVYKYPCEDLKDETFDGAVWSLRIPPAIVRLSEDIDNWVEKYQDAANSPYQSESFKGYSYSKAGTGTGGGGSNATWQTVFADQLNRWRKI